MVVIAFTRYLYIRRPFHNLHFNVLRLASDDNRRWVLYDRVGLAERQLSRPFIATTRSWHTCSRGRALVIQSSARFPRRSRSCWRRRVALVGSTCPAIVWHAARRHTYATMHLNYVADGRDRDHRVVRQHGRSMGSPKLAQRRRGEALRRGNWHPVGRRSHWSQEGDPPCSDPATSRLGELFLPQRGCETGDRPLRERRLRLPAAGPWPGVLPVDRLATACASLLGDPRITPMSRTLLAHEKLTPRGAVGGFLTRLPLRPSSTCRRSGRVRSDVVALHCPKGGLRGAAAPRGARAGAAAGPLGVPARQYMRRKIHTQ